MDLPVSPPVSPMLARLARELPGDGYLYEPKWDGFRCLAFREGGHVELRSRHDRPFARYFPEVVEAVSALPAERVVLDGEIVVVTEGGFEFETLMSRLHPAASRVEMLASETPATFVAFDLLALGDEDLRPRPFGERRGHLEEVVGSSGSRLRVTPITDDPAQAARWLEAYQGAGIDGVVAKHRDLPYQPGKRTMVKVKRERTAECVVAGWRPYVDRPVVASLLLAMYDGDELVHVGVASSFPNARRAELAEELRPLTVPLEEHPWRDGFSLAGGPAGRLAGSAGRWTPDMEHDWVPIRPALVCEVAYTQVDGRRFRHPARFLRWRPDREPRSCSLDQLDPIAAPAPLP